MATALGSASKSVYRFSLFMSILMIVFGLLAIALPLATSLGIVLIIGWLVIFGGFAQLIHAFQSKGIGHIAWKVLVALLYIVAGVYLIAHPGLGIAGFTLALAFFLCAEGVVDIVAYFFASKDVGSSFWLLLDGIITLFLGVLIWKQWPASSVWVIGTLVGISLVMNGITRLNLTLAAGKVVKSLAG